MLLRLLVATFVTPFLDADERRYYAGMANLLIGNHWRARLGFLLLLYLAAHAAVYATPKLVPLAFIQLLFIAPWWTWEPGFLLFRLNWPLLALGGVVGAQILRRSREVPVRSDLATTPISGFDLITFLTRTLLLLSVAVGACELLRLLVLSLLSDTGGPSIKTILSRSSMVRMHSANLVPGMVIFNELLGWSVWLLGYFHVLTLFCYQWIVWPGINRATAAAFLILVLKNALVFAVLSRVPYIGGTVFRTNVVTQVGWEVMASWLLALAITLVYLHFMVKLSGRVHEKLVGCEPD